MPLITITCGPGYSPSDNATVRKFGLSLPQLMLEAALELSLADYVEPSDVKVIFHSFSDFDINSPDLLIKVEFIERRRRRQQRKGAVVLEAIIKHNLLAGLEDSQVREIMLDVRYGADNVILWTPW